MSVRDNLDAVSCPPTLGGEIGMSSVHPPSILASLKNDNSNVITELALDAIPVVEKLDFGASFAAHDEAGDAPMREGTTGAYNFGKNILYLMSPLDLTHTGNKPFEANQHALDSTGSSQDLSEAPEPQLVENDSEDLDGDVTLRLYITGRFVITTEILYLDQSHTDLELQCTTEGYDFPPLDTVRLAVVGLATEDEEVWLVKRTSENTWKQVLSDVEL